MKTIGLLISDLIDLKLTDTSRAPNAIDDVIAEIDRHVEGLRQRPAFIGGPQITGPDYNRRRLRLLESLIRTWVHARAKWDACPASDLQRFHHASSALAVAENALRNAVAVTEEED